MDYVLIHGDVHLGKLFNKRKANNSVDFAKYGLDISTGDLKAVQGFDGYNGGAKEYSGTFCQVLAIVDRPLFETQLQMLSNSIAALNLPDGAISIVTKAQRDTVDSDVEASRTAYAADHPYPA